MNKRLLISTCLAALVVGAGSAAPSAQEFTGLYAFGDSLTDTGNLSFLSGGVEPPASAGYVDGRFSNGPVWIESFAPALGLTVDFNTPFQQNQAIGGALTGFDGESGTPGIGVLSQVANFTGAGGTIGGNDLVVLWAGANDYLDNIGANPTDVVANLTTAITDLAAAGGTQFLVPNLPDLGDTPGGAGSGAGDLFNQLTADHNAALADAMETLRRSLGIEIILVDVNTVFDDVLANPGAFGFANVTVPCLDATRTETGACTTSAETDATLFWDPIHPTATGHLVLADFMTGTLVTTRTGPRTVSAQAAMMSLVTTAQLHAVAARLYEARAGGSALSFLGNQFGFSGPTGVQLASADWPGAPGEDARPQLAQSVGQSLDIEKPLTVFVFGNYATGNRDQTSKQAGFDYDTWVVSAGADYRINEQFLAGASFGYGRGEADLDDAAGAAELDSYVLTLYGSFTFEGFYADASVGYSFDDYKDITRATGSAFLPEAQAETDGGTIFVTFAGGYSVALNNFSLGPTAGIRYARSQIDGYTETGAGALNLSVDDQTDESVIGSLGLQGSARFDTGFATLVPQLRLSFEHEFKDDDHRIRASLPGGEQADLQAEPGDRDVLMLGVGLGARFSANVVGLIDYETSLARSDGSDHSIQARVRIGF